MKKQIPIGLTHLLSLSLLALTASLTLAQSAAISYQGRLTESGNLATGVFDMQFKLFDAAAAGAQQGTTIPKSAVPVTNGVFTVTLDFGVAVFDGSARFLEVGVRRGTSNPYTTLAPRQQVASIPYAIRSLTAATANTATTATTLVNGAGVRSLNGLKDDVTLAAGANVTLTPNGNTLTIAATGGGGGSSLWNLNGVDAYYNNGNVGIGTNIPKHRLSLNGGPNWTANGWIGAMELQNGSALAWQANTAGQRFGLGHANTGFYLFRTASNPANVANPALYDFVVNDEGNVGIGTVTPFAGYRLDVKGATLLEPGGNGGGFITFGAPNGETGMLINGTGNNRADLRFDGSTLKLVATAAAGPPPAENGIAITTAGRVGIGTAAPDTKLHVEAAGVTAVIHGKATGANTAVFGESTSTASGTAAVYGKNLSGFAIGAEGNAAQNRDKGGFVKAMAYIDPFLPFSQYVVRCYNSQQTGAATSTAPCGIMVTRSQWGQYQIDFGFNVEDRFISLTPQATHTQEGVVVGMITGVSGSKVSVLFERNSHTVFSFEQGTFDDSRFHIIVY